VSGLGAPLSQPGRSPTSRSSGAARVEIRPYRDEDADATLAVFHAAVTGTAAADYHGFSVQAEQHPVLGGVWMTNFRMTKPITTSG
jgi:hypothetical protein